MKKYIPEGKPEIADILANKLQLSTEQQQFLDTLSSEDKATLFFKLLADKGNVSEISKRIVDLGFDQNNLLFEGLSGAPGDQLSVCRWLKAASGALIVPMRYNKQGDLEMLFGKKGDIWVLPGGHYELDEHRNLEHSFVAELMEETGIVPNNEEFQGYIAETLEHANHILPYNSVLEAGNFVSNRFTWNLETVLSGANLGYGKRIILAVYSILFHDGDTLKARAADDLEALSWFSNQEIMAGNADKDFSLAKLLPAHYDAIQYVLKRGA